MMHVHQVAEYIRKVVLICHRTIRCLKELFHLKAAHSQPLINKIIAIQQVG